MRWIASGALASILGLSVALFSVPALGQQAPPERSEAWGDATTILAASAMGIELLMPRVFYADPEVTIGWKARWHASVLAPSMTLAAMALFNEEVLKEAFGGHRPGCTDETQGGPGCRSYAMLSTHAFAASSAFGQGLGIFLLDTFKWSNGQVNFGAFAVNTGVPAVLAVITTIGRGAGNWEQPGQAWGSAGIGLLVGFGMGALYGAAQRPECGYSGSLICW